ncbi:G2/M phase-specific E3 ubiquitin-protein ligase-like [Anneissia japonica]|uniref:G2/M phase-specific E3 ubiquitin-protein ligase-like n=1 Tax=Anneissia japonica TaxID=1529436 RepID=UPI0014258B4C|nr:G2/M phase-specific E3 ubiquitin-protein ligase-like [Anneissia japonica]
METLGVLIAAMQSQPMCCQEAFIAAPDPKLTAAKIRTLFKTNFSAIGSNWRAKEDRTAVFWLDYLMDAEENEAQCSCQNVLEFASGATDIPITGFDDKPELEFLRDDSRFPTANTCSIIFRLPTKHETYDNFKEAVDFGILNTQSFGMA